MAKKFYTFDCETDPFKFGRIPQPFIWGCFDGKEYWQFNTADEFAQFIKNQDALFYAHNGGKFDFHFLAKHINRNEKILMINSRLVKANIGKAEIRDSYALIPFPLSAYKKDDFDYTKLEKNVREKHKEEIQKYLKNDCVYLWELINEFFTEYGRHLTAPGAAIKMLQKIEKIKIGNPGQFFFNEFQKYYYGGRCECLKPGSHYGEINYFDINSAYPYAMQHQHPFGEDYEIKYYDNPPIIPWGFYTVLAKSYGAFCRRENGGLKFDWDGEEREYHVTGWELKAALETHKCVIIKHLEQKFFSESKSFTDFINHFWNLRQTTKKGSAQNLFCKLMMNSAYGKFAANPENYSQFVLFDPEIAEYLVGEGWELRGEIGPHIIASQPLDEYDMRFYNVATGASITGFVRSMLIRALTSVDKPIYCDTDSIIFQGKHSLRLSDNLGAWGIDGIFDEGHFAGKKLYAVKNKDGEKLASKGSKLKYNEIVKIAGGQTIIYEQEAPVFSWFKDTRILTRNIKRTVAQ